MLVTDYLDFCVESYSEQVCLKQLERHLSYGQFAVEVGCVCRGLATAGVLKGDRVAVLSENSIEQLVIFYACAALGAVYVPLNFRLAPQELAYILSDSEAKVLFAGSASLIEAVERIDVKAKLPSLVRCVISDPNLAAQSGWLSWQGFVPAEPQAVVRIEISQTDTVYQMYTSGTTGLPKGVMISHEQLCHFISAYHAMPPRRQMGEVHLAVAPLFHAAAFSLVLAAFSCVRPIVILPAFDPQEVLQVVERERVADTLLVPAMLNAIVAEAGRTQVDLSSLKVVTYGGSGIEVDQLKLAAEVLGCDFQQGFGMTEMVSGLIWLSPQDHQRALAGKSALLKSCGRPAPGIAMKVVDPETGLTLPAGEVGEVLLRGGQMMQGYWKLPEKTAEALDQGWYHSGDAGCIDEEGYLYIKDRIKDMVVSGGENIYPAEVEAVLMAHPAVQDVAVIGVPDEKFGEALVACCVLDFPAGEDQEHLTVDSMVGYCRDKIAGYKIPRRYQFLDVLPRNAAGKILKRELRESYSDV